jgi:hypothetical protein
MTCLANSVIPVHSLAAAATSTRQQQQQQQQQQGYSNKVAAEQVAEQVASHPCHQSK